MIKMGKILGALVMAVSVSTASLSACELTIDSITTSNLLIQGTVTGNVGSLTSGTTGVVISGGAGSLLGSGASINIQNATDAQPGLLTAADHAVFSAKATLSDVTNSVLANLTSANLTASNVVIQGTVSGNVGSLTSGTAGVSIVGGNGALLGSGASVNIQNATDYQPGLLTAADHATFSSKTSPTDVTNAVLSLTADTPQIIFSNLTVYVSTNGSDSNDGFSQATSLRTIQHAVDLATSLWIPSANATITVQVGAGSYLGAILRRGAGPGAFKLVGNPSSPGSVVLNGTNQLYTLYVIDSASWLIDGFTLQSTNNSDGISAGLNGVANFQNIIFGPGLNSQLFAWKGGRITALSNYSITGGATRHLFTLTTGTIDVVGKTVTVSGTPTFWIFAVTDTCGVIEAAGATFSGSATGRRYVADANGTIYASGNVNLFPGNLAGTTSYGGQYW